MTCKRESQLSSTEEILKVRTLQVSFFPLCDAQSIQRWQQSKLKFLKKKKYIYILKSGSWTLSIIICNRMNLFLFIMYKRFKQGARTQLNCTKDCTKSNKILHADNGQGPKWNEMARPTYIIKKKKWICHFYMPPVMCVCFIPFGCDSPRQIWLKSPFCFPFFFLHHIRKWLVYYTMDSFF